jgi:hypothetical protein
MQVSEERSKKTIVDVFGKILMAREIKAKARNFIV